MKILHFRLNMRSPFFWRRFSPQKKLFFEVGIAALITVLLPIAITTFQYPEKADAAWFNDNYAYRKAITLTNTTAETFKYATLANYDASDTSKYQTDCGDVRFTKQNGQLLPYTVDTCDATTNFHVEIDSLPASSTQTIYIYFGNPAVDNGFMGADQVAACADCSFGTPDSEEKGPAPFNYWKMDDGQGSTSEDATATNEDLSVSGPTWQTEDQCISGKCLYADGSNDDLNSASAIDLSTTNVVTVEFWLKWTTYADDDDVAIEFTADTTGSTGGFAYIPNSSDFGGGLAEVFLNGNAGFETVTFARPSANVWHHFALVLDKSAGAGSEITVYIDGKPTTQTVQASNNNTNNFASDSLYLMSRGGATLFGQGFIDDVKIFKYARSAAQVRADFNARGNESSSINFGNNKDNNPSALSNGLVRYWKMNETAENTCTGGANDTCDSSGNSGDGAWSNQATAAVGKFGNGVVFDGTNDKITFGTTDPLPDKSHTTLAVWVNLGSVTGTRSIFNKDAATSPTGWSAYLSGTTMGFYSDPTASTVEASLTTGVWTHLAWVFDSGTVFFYKNGQLLGSASGYPTLAEEALAQLALGIKNNTDGEDFQGTMDEARIYSRALSNSDISSLYQFAPGPVGSWSFNEKTGASAFDISGNSNTGDLKAVRSTTWTSGKYGSAINFDGSDQHVSREDDSDFDFGTAASFTYSAWVKHAVSPATAERIFTKFDTTAGNGGFALQIETDGDFTCGIDDDEASFPEDSALSTAATYDDGNWHYVSCVKDGTAGLHLYIDGVLVVSDSSISSTGDFANADPLYIGIDEAGTGSDFIGQIDEPKIYNYARSQKQVIEDMNAGHPAPGSPVGSALGHWKFDEGALNTCSGGSNDGCNSGNGGTLDAAFSGNATWTHSGKFNKAMALDGSGDYASVADAAALDLTGSFTIAVWYYPVAFNTEDEILQKGTADDCENYGLAINASAHPTLLSSASCSFSSFDAENITLTTGTWHYLAVTFDGTNARFYHNGKLRDTLAWTIGSTNATALTIGGDGATAIDYVNGRLDELKLYTSALTAEQVKQDMNRGSQMVAGALSDNSTYQPNAANQEFCVPGDTTSCAAPGAYWRFEEGSGSTAFDISGNGNNGTANSANKYAPGKVGKAHLVPLGANGGQGIDFGDNDAFDPTAAITVEMWHMPFTLDGGNLHMLNKSSWGFYRQTNANICSANNLCFDISLTGGDVTLNYAQSNLTANTWYHLAGTYDGTTVRFYINGVQVGSSAGSGTINVGTNKLCLGDQSDGSDCSNGFNADGRYDELKIFTYARTPAQIEWDYSRGAPVGHWKFDETTDNTCSGGTNDACNSGTQGSTYDGAFSNSPTRTTSGKLNSALDFDGTDDVVTITNNPAIDRDTGLSNGQSFAGWIYADTDGENDVGEMFDKGSGTYCRTDNEASGLDIECQMDLVTTDPNVNIADAFSTGGWHHIAAVYDNDADDDMILYIDGRARGTGDGSGAPATTDTDNLLIGGDSAANFDGKIDDFRVYNYGLTATQVRQIMNDTGATRFGPVTGNP